MWRVVLSKKVEKQINDIDKRWRSRIYSTLVYLLAMDPLAGKKCGGLKSRYSVRVWPYRVIYELNKEKRVVLVIRGGHRQGVCRDF